MHYPHLSQAPAFLFSRFLAFHRHPAPYLPLISLYHDIMYTLPPDPPRSASSVSPSLSSNALFSFDSHDQRTILESPASSSFSRELSDSEDIPDDKSQLHTPDLLLFSSELGLRRSSRQRTVNQPQSHLSDSSPHPRSSRRQTADGHVKKPYSKSYNHVSSAARAPRRATNWAGPRLRLVFLRIYAMGRTFRLPRR